jgi:hypothetical protein
LEENEEAIEHWYFNHQGSVPLKKYLCSEKALKGDDDSCLMEELELENSPKINSKQKSSKEPEDKDEL